MYKSNVPSCVYGGKGSLSQIGSIIKKEGAERILLFTDKGIANAGLLSPVEEILRESGISWEVHSDIAAEPSYEQVQKVVDEAAKNPGDLVIGVGGGSVMDAAKLYTLLQGADYTVKDLLKDPAQGRKMVKSIMVPTTCGTGSEATCNAIVAVPEDSVKVGIVNDAMIPDYAVLDPFMIKGLPKSIIAATGVDALAHAVECYTSRKANPLSDGYAKNSAKLIFENIRKAYSNPDDMEAKTSMLIGAFYGGAAITASGTTAVHALSYPLGGKFHIPHGVSNAILFAPVMAFNKDACQERLAQLCDLIKPEMARETESEKAQWVIDEIAAIVRFTEIPETLESFGVTEEHMDFLVDAASKVTRLLNNNMKTMSLEDIRGVYKQIL